MNHPEIVSLELSQICNLRCPKCAFVSDLKVPPFISEQAMESVLKSSEKWSKPIYFDLTGRGEPLLYPKFEDTLHRILSLGHNRGFNTNGMLLDSIITAVLKTDTHVAISLDSLDESTYCILQTGGDFVRVNNNIMTLLARRVVSDSKTKVNINFVESKANRNQKAEFIKFWRTLGVDNVLVVQLSEDLLEDNAPSGSCTFPERVMPIRCNGDVIFCIKHPITVGNVNEESANDVWNGDRRRELLEGRFSMGFCDKCYSRFCYAGDGEKSPIQNFKLVDIECSNGFKEDF